jgi:diacylglycerol kinase
MGIRHSVPRSFYYAFQGLKTAFRGEPNLRIHITIGSIALVAAILLHIETWEWLLLMFTIFYVITLELLNTVLESVVNLVSPEIREDAKIAKDVSAGCVLIGAIMAVVEGLIIFVPKIISLLYR